MSSLQRLVCFSLPALLLAQQTCKVTTTRGCFYDKAELRLLPIQVNAQAALTHESCAAACSRFGKLAGVEFGSQCFCGDKFNPAANATAEPASDCTVMKCPGDKAQGCGNADRILIFEYSCTGKPLPNFHGCVEESAKALPYCDISKSFEERALDLRSRLSLAEKIASISPQPKLGGTCATHTAGKDSIGFPAWSWLTETNTAVAGACISEGRCATTFSGPLGMAASFNRTSWYMKGRVIGTEMRAFSNAGWHRGNPGDFVTLTGYGPNINVARDPRFGRTSELPGEDPLLNGKYAVEMVTGMQEKDARGYPAMLAYLKHLTAYSTESNRGHDSYAISTHDLFETYLPQYEMAFVQGEATGAMCSYDAINGHPSCANGFVLNDVVRGRWNRSDAHVTTDCGAVSNLMGPPVRASAIGAAAMALNNGTDIEMGSTVWTDNLQSAVAAGRASEDSVDHAWLRSYLPHFRAGRFDPPGRVSWTSIGIEALNSTEHQGIAHDAALQSLVLLRNNEGLLPLAAGRKVAVVGPLGVTRSGLLSDYAGDQQCFTSDALGPACIPTIGEALSEINPGATTSAMGVEVNSQNASAIPAALALVRAADVVVLVLGIDKTIEHEGIDRTEITLPGLQTSFAKQVLAHGKPTVLVLCNGGPLAIDEILLNKPSPSAIIEAYNPSVYGPRAIAQSVYGRANRWGKLVQTIYPLVYVNEQSMTNYDMAKPPGRTYRYYTGSPLFAFGSGLSLTTFALDCTAKHVGTGAVWSTIACTVHNTGTRSGDEVLLVYHSAGDDVRAAAKHPVPLRSLVDFARVGPVAAGKGVNVSFNVTGHTMMLVDENGERRLYQGRHTIVVSRNTGEGKGDDYKLAVDV